MIITINKTGNISLSKADIRKSIEALSVFTKCIAAGRSQGVPAITPLLIKMEQVNWYLTWFTPDPWRASFLTWNRFHQRISVYTNWSNSNLSPANQFDSDSFRLGLNGMLRYPMHHCNSHRIIAPFNIITPKNCIHIIYEIVT